jgi:hypothetical protein
MFCRFNVSIALALCGLLAAAACSKDPDPAVTEDAGVDLGLPDTSDDTDAVTAEDTDLENRWQDPQALDQPNALGHGGHPLLPWPADQYMADQDGALIQAPDARMLPVAFTPPLIRGSGASRITPIVTWLPGSIDPATLPDPDDWGATLSPDSSVRVIVLQDDAEPEPWPVLAEIDATARNRHDATLIIRPHRPFPSGARVAVGLRTSLKTYACALPDDADFDREAYPCRTHEPAEALARVLENRPESEAEAAWVRRGRDELTAALPLMAGDPAEFAQAWTFTVRFGAEIVDPMVQMQRIAAEADASDYVLDDVVYEDNRALVYGTVAVPWFLDENDRLVVDDNGVPQIQETRHTPFLVTIPRTVTAPRPVVLFGHGFFSAIEEPTWGNLFGGLSRWQMSAVTTRFHGFAEVDFAKAAAVITARTLDGLAGIIDLQRQSQANFTVVHNMIRHHLAAELTVDFGDGAFHPLDPSNIPYMGISNGGTQGLLMMSTSPVLDRGALVVPGGGWSHMLQRAAQWSTLGTAYARRFSSQSELQLSMAMFQHIFDPVDSLNFVEHLISDRLPGLPQQPEILIVEAVNDAQVANMVTRWVAGTAGVPLIIPSVAEVWNIPTTEATAPDGAPGGVGYEIYDLLVPDNPPGNIAATENGVHERVRLLDAYREQMGIFLEHGRVVRTCDGACDPE